MRINMFRASLEPILLALIGAGAVMLAASAGEYWLFDSRPHLLLSRYLLPQNLSAHNLILAITSFDDSVLGRPVSMLSFVLESWITASVDAQLMRWTNIVIHCVNGLLVYLIGRRLGCVFLSLDLRKSQRFGLLVAAVWLLNPLHVSSVLYVIQRMTLLAATFSLTGLLVYIRWRSGEGGKEGMVGALLLLSISLALATLAKENGVVLVFLVALLEVLWPTSQRGDLVQRYSRRIAGAILVLAPLTVLASLLVFPEFYQQWYIGRDFSVWERVMTQSRLLWHYVSWFFMPLPQHLGLYHDDIRISTGLMEPWTTLPAIVFWIGIIYTVIRCRRSLVMLALGLGFFLYGHSLESTVIPLEMVFEHRNYLPSVGLALISAWGLMVLIERTGQTGLMVCVGFVTFLLALLALRSLSWSSEEVLAHTQFRHHPESDRSLYHYANMLLRKGENGEDQRQKKALIVNAYAYYEKLATRDATALVAPVTLLYMDARYFNGRFSERWQSAIAHALESTPRLSSTDYNALNLLAGCVASGWCAAFDERVIGLLNSGVERFPRSVSIHRNLAEIQLARNHPEQSLLHVRQALELRPSTDLHWIGAAAASRLNRTDVVMEHITALQNEDVKGRYHQKIIDLFRHGRTNG